MKPLDSIDLQILNILQDDCTVSVKEVAEKVGLSFTPTYERIRSLKQRGVIKKNVAILDRGAIGYNIMTYCNIVLKEQTRELLADFEERITREPQVLEVVSLTGTYDYMLKIVAKDINDYGKFMTQVIATMPNVGQYHSSIVLYTIKDETKIELGVENEKVQSPG